MTDDEIEAEVERLVPYVRAFDRLQVLLQPDGSPPSGGPELMVEWIAQAAIARAEKAEAEVEVMRGGGVAAYEIAESRKADLTRAMDRARKAEARVAEMEGALIEALSALYWVEENEPDPLPPFMAQALNRARAVLEG